jgi:hypothetical protein
MFFTHVYTPVSKHRAAFYARYTERAYYAGRSQEPMSTKPIDTSDVAASLKAVEDDEEVLKTAEDPGVEPAELEAAPEETEVDPKPNRRERRANKSKTRREERKAKKAQLVEIVVSDDDDLELLEDAEEELKDAKARAYDLKFQAKQLEARADQAVQKALEDGRKHADYLRAKYKVPDKEPQGVSWDLNLEQGKFIRVDRRQPQQ